MKILPMLACSAILAIGASVANADETRLTDEQLDGVTAGMFSFSFEDILPGIPDFDVPELDLPGTGELPDGIPDGIPSERPDLLGLIGDLFDFGDLPSFPNGAV